MPSVKDYLPSPGFELVRHLLDYNANTGVFHWKIRSGGRSSGTIAGCKTKHGYISITIAGKAYLAHRLAWLISYGVWPEAQIDHINGDRADNQLANLRPATANENAWNQKVCKTNKSGFKGVYFHLQSQKWRAVIGANNKRISLGLHHTAKDAAKAYAAASAIHHQEFSRTAS